MQDRRGQTAVIFVSRRTAADDAGYAQAAAIAWRDQPEDAAIREAGRTRWYEWYRTTIATVDRSHDWTGP